MLQSIVPITDNRRRFLLQLISREQNFISALHFGMQRFVQPLQERKDLITPNDHRTLFQNIDELLRISEDILEQLSNDGHEPQMNFASRVYISKTTAICAAYKKYCNGIKRADCILVNKSRQAGSEFLAFINEPPVPRKRPDLTMFIHRPLQHFREILKLMQMLASNCHVDTEEYKNFNSVINELQAAYREITVSSGLMEPLCEGRPLLTLQDLESRMVFTKCKPFTLAVQGRQWIFGGDLTRVEGRSIKPYWTLLFSDIIVFAKVSRDRVLFITEEPVPIANIVDSCFNMRKKTTEFRLTVDPNGRLAESPTGYCAPDLSRTPKKGLRRKSLILRAPSLELKAVWQNLLQRQIFLVNAALGSTPLSSPLDSPDVLNTLVPLSDIGFASTSISSMKIPSMDSINHRNQQIHHHQQQQQQQQQQPQQVRLFRQRTIRSDNSASYENLQRLARALAATHISTRLSQTTQEATTSCSQIDSPARTHSPCLLASGGSCLSGGTGGQLNESVHSLRSSVLGRRQIIEPRPICAARAYNHSVNNSATWLSCSGSSLNTQTLCSGDNLFNCKCLTAIPETITEVSLDGNGHKNRVEFSIACDELHADHCCHNFMLKNMEKSREIIGNGKSSKLVDFNLSSVGRSFIDESDILRNNLTGNFSLTTPESPTLIKSPTCKSESFSNDFVADKHDDNMEMVVPLAQFEGSWDLLEMDLNLHEVNLDPNYDTDVEEFIFHGDEPQHKSVQINRHNSENDDDDEIELQLVVDDPFGILPTQPTPPDSLDL